MNEVLTMDEIKARYPSEHVLLEDPQTNEHMQVVGGRVLWHSKDLDEVYRKGIELRPKHSAFVFTGLMPDHEIVYVL
jgi:hypothetical protein